MWHFDLSISFKQRLNETFFFFFHLPGMKFNLIFDLTRDDYLI